MVPALAGVDATRLREAPPPFFIMGCPRSGTTLLSQLLDNHARIAVFVESLYYPLFRGDLHRYGDLRRPPNLRRLIDNFLEMVYVNGLYQVEPPSTDELQAAVPAPTFEAVFATFLQLYALRQGKVRCGEKTARHHEYVTEIQAELPSSPIVFAMRDPRDVVLSIREMFGARLESGAEWWNGAFRSYQQVVGSAYMLRYEELVGKPRPTLEQLSTFLGEEYDPRMLEFFTNLPKRLRDAPHHRKLSTPISDTSVGRFRALPAAEIARIEHVCAVGMEALGYEPIGVRARAASKPPERVTPLGVAVDRLRRFRRRSHRLGWYRWKMRLRVRARYLLTFGPLRDN